MAKNRKEQKGSPTPSSLRVTLSSSRLVQRKGKLTAMNVSTFLHPVVQIYEIRILIISKQSLINQMKLRKTVIQCKNIGSIIHPNKKGALNLKFRNSQRKIKLYINFPEIRLEEYPSLPI